MSKLLKHNFDAGPFILPKQILNRTAEVVKHWDASGLSILEISHRSREFEGMMQSANSGTIGGSGQRRRNFAA